MTTISVEAHDRICQDLHQQIRSLIVENEKLRAALAEPERALTDEVIGELWHKNGGFHHHFARAVERWLKGSS